MPRVSEGLEAEAAVRRWEVFGEWILEVKILVHHWRMVGVSGRSLRMYGFVGWKDRGTMVVREGRLSKVAERTVKGFDGVVILLDVFGVVVCRGSRMSYWAILRWFFKHMSLFVVEGRDRRQSSTWPFRLWAAVSCFHSIDTGNTVIEAIDKT